MTAPSREIIVQPTDPFCAWKGCRRPLLPGADIVEITSVTLTTERETLGITKVCRSCWEALYDATSWDGPS